MALEPRFALQQLVAALEKHLEAVISRRGPEDSSVEQAYFQVADAFSAYEESLDEHYQEILPMINDEEE
ncbi:MAG: hypothetical protein ACKOWE_06190 [Micrococcales bacterium]